MDTDDTDLQPDDPPPKPWPKKRLEIIAALWSAFLAACIGTAIFFSQFGPDVFSATVARIRIANALTGYAIGFFFFWLIAAVAALLTLTLVRPAANDSQSNGVPPER